MFYLWLILKKLAIPHVLALIAIALLVIIGYLSKGPLGDNNVIEEVSEEILKDEFHIDVEFSPPHKYPLPSIVNNENKW